VFYLQKGGIKRYFQALAVVLCLLLMGCAVPNSDPFTSSIVPVSGKDSGSFQVHEYALVEQSTDNPNHVEFQERAPAAVAAQSIGWPFTRLEDAVQATNQALASFGYRLAANPSPPFSGYALYHNQTLVQRDIARFWPVSLQKANDDNGKSDFLLSFETLNGEKLVASTDGIRPWSGQDQSVGSTPPVYFGDQIVYAESVGSEIGFSGNLSDSEIQSLQTLDDDMNVNAHDLNLLEGYDSAFGWQEIAGQPFYFFNRGDLIHLNYAGRDLPYTYDQVVHNNSGKLAIFNPGGTLHIAWFYALRDGVWYYVEAGVFE
jgi:hypothetical protein